MNGVNMNIKILTPSGYRSFFKIEKKQGECLRITFEDTVIECTKDHKFDYNGTPLVASEIYVGLVINNHKVIKIEDIGIQTVYTPVEVEGRSQIYFKWFSSLQLFILGFYSNINRW